MTITTEFKEFILRGKVIDLAVGVAVGGAFTKVVEALVKEIVMPVFGIIGIGLNIKDLKFILRSGNGAELNEVAVNYGVFFNAILTFLIVGVVVFFFIRILNKIYKEDKTDQAKITNELLAKMYDMMAQNNDKCKNMRS